MHVIIKLDTSVHNAITSHARQLGWTPEEFIDTALKKYVLEIEGAIEAKMLAMAAASPAL
jgi:hypothetical protein